MHNIYTGNAAKKEVQRFYEKPGLIVISF